MKVDPIRVKALELAVEFWAAAVGGNREFSGAIGTHCILDYANEFEAHLRTEKS